MTKVTKWGEPKGLDFGEGLNNLASCSMGAVFGDLAVISGRA